MSDLQEILVALVITGCRGADRPPEARAGKPAGTGEVVASYRGRTLTSDEVVQELLPFQSLIPLRVTINTRKR